VGRGESALPLGNNPGLAVPAVALELPFRGFGWCRQCDAEPSLVKLNKSNMALLCRPERSILGHIQHDGDPVGVFQPMIAKHAGTLP
jgi:hypothetical protein